MKNKLYEKYHLKSTKQFKVIGERNFTYVNIIPILKTALDSKIKKVLDIGCGSGTISFYLSSRGYDVTGIDISKKAIKACTESAQLMGLKKTKFMVSNFPNEIPSGRYDLVFFSEVIEHLPNDDLALRRIYKLLNRNGTLLLSTPSINAPLHRLGLTKKFDEEVGHLRRYTVEELTMKLRKNGFKVKKTYKKESILRNYLFLNRYAGKSIRFIRFFLVDVFSYIDNVLIKLFGESQIIIVAKKAGN